MFICQRIHTTIRQSVFGARAGAILLSILMAVTWLSSSGVSSAAPSASAKSRLGDSPPVASAYGQLPMTFERNQGQTDSRVDFLARGSGYTLFLSGEQAVFALRQPVEVETPADVENTDPPEYRSEMLTMVLVGSNANPAVSGEDVQPGISNYFLGNDPDKWVTDVPHYGQVRYQGVYPGVDLLYYGNQQELQYDFIVAPGADPESVRLEFAQAERLELDDNGDLLIHIAGGTVRQQAPFTYQNIDGARAEITSWFVLHGDHEVGFEIGTYDPALPLVIDPVLVYSTYLGGSGEEWIHSIAVDSSGAVYVTGATTSSNFPLMNPYQATYVWYDDVFVTKLSPNGSSLVYSTYLGGYESERAWSIAVDNSGAAYITGQTESDIFPTVNPYQTYQGPMNIEDAFVTKLAPAGNALIYSTYLGGNGSDIAMGIAVDSSGSAYVTGGTRSNNFPTENPYQILLSGAFVTKLAVDGSSLVYSTYLGGNGIEFAYDIAVDSSGSAYVTGETGSTDFPTVNAYQALFGGYIDGFVTKLSPSGNELLYSTYLGGSDADNGWSIAVDDNGSAYVTGQAYSDNFPTMAPYQGTYQGDGDVFVSKLSPAGNNLLYSTYMGTANGDGGRSIAIDSSGKAYVIGWTRSNGFPVVDPYQATYQGGLNDAFVSVFTPGGGSLVYSTYLGGSSSENGESITIDSSGAVYVAGMTESTDFPTLNSYQINQPGNDGFITKFAPVPSFTVTNTNDSGSGSLRQAIIDANARPGTDMITFNIPGTGPHTIAPLSALPAITDPVIIDGTTQPGASCDSWPPTLMIELDGENAGSSDGLTIEAEDSVIRGLVVNRFSHSGISIAGPSNNNTIQCNFIGTDVTGTLVLGNAVDGIKVASDSNIIGTNSDGVSDDLERNVISGNLNGIEISLSTGNHIAGNYIGTDLTGTQPLGNQQYGISMPSFSQGNIIGGSANTEGNIIAFNGLDGIGIASYYGLNINNQISRNQIHSNGELGIDLGLDGVTPNDAGDDDTGPNKLRNYPVLTGATDSLIVGWLPSMDDTSYTFEFFANTECDPSGYGEGRTYLEITTSAVVTKYFYSYLTFYVTLAEPAPIGQYLTATVTDLDGNTSEFSKCIPIIPSHRLFTVTNTNADGPGSLKWAIFDANIYPGRDTITFDIPGEGPHTIIVPSSNKLPIIVEPIIIDGTTQPGASCDSWPPTLMINIYNKSRDPGITLETGDSMIRGLVINGNAISLEVKNGDNNVIQCNFLGTTPSGTAAFDEAQPEAGIRVSISNNNVIGTNGDGITDETERNVIAAMYGIWLRVANGNIVAGNFVGTDVTGTVGIGGNWGLEGIRLFDNSAYNIIGTNGDGSADNLERNLVSNNMDGIVIGYGAHDNVVAGNYIGTDITGTQPIGNRHAGIVFELATLAPNNLIGGDTDSERNLIAYNQGAGIVDQASSSSTNTFSGNIIHSNGGLGIDLRGDGVTANDPGDADTGPNGLQNYPVLTSATPTAIEGTLNSTPDTTFTLEFFSNSECDPSGYGEGETFQLVTEAPMVTTNASGDVSFNFGFANPVPLGRYITATATNPAGSTSEFSVCSLVLDVVNQPPENHMPGAQVTDFDTLLTITPAISISDPDAGLNLVEVTLSVTSGTLTLSGTTGLTFRVGDGTADAAMTFTGTISAINTALDGLIFTPASGFSGDAPLTITTSDQGYTGTGGPLSDTDNLDITVNPPGAPVPLSPVNAALLNDNTPTFTWDALAWAAMYRLQVDNDSTFGSPAIDAAVNATTYTPLVPLADGTYYWRVQGLDVGSQTGAWSAVWTFTIDPLRLAAPGLVRPKDHTATKDTTPAFLWKNVKGAVNYQFHLSDDYNFSSTLTDVQTLTVRNYTLPAGSELDYGVYYWRVRAQDANGNWSDWSYTNTVIITILSSPKNAQHLTDTTPTLKWQSAALGALYEVQVDEINEDFSTPVFSYNGTAKSISAAELLGNDYQWRARADIGTGWSVWTPIWTFTITPPTTVAPKLISPANYSKLNTITPEFTWDSVPNGVIYQIQISLNSGFKTPVQDVTLDPGDLDYTADPLLNGGKYFWRVRAINAEGVAGTWSAKWQFTLNQLVKPVLLAPVTGTQTTDTTPDLSWYAVADAVSYEIQLGTDKKFGTPDQILTSVGTSVIPASLPDGKYYWRVRGVNAFGVTGLWSDKWNVTIDTTGPDQPVLRSPKDLAGTRDTTPYLVWKSAKTAKQYQLQVAENATFTQIEVDVTVSGTSYTVPVADALDYGVHYWHVKATDALGNWGDWSTPFQFALSTMLTPKDGTATTGARPTFYWAAVPGAVAYHFELADNPDFISPVETYTGLNRSYRPPAPLTPGVYYWHVQVDTGAGYGDWMPTWTLVITPAKPGKPVLSNPTNKAILGDNTPTFAWLASLNGSTYQIQIDNNSDFSSPAQDMTVGVGLLSYVADELADGKYYWHVRAFNTDTAPGPWSAKWNFTIDTTASAVPELLAPLDEAVSTNRMLKLTWSKVDGASGYELRLDQDDTFPLPVISAGNKTTYTPPTPLSRGVYHWQVRALDKAGNASAWSDAWSFEIVAGVTAPLIETPTPVPAAEPTSEPIVEPTAEPTMEPPVEPTVEPTTEPIIITPESTTEPTIEPTATPEPTVGPPPLPVITLPVIPPPGP